MVLLTGRIDKEGFWRLEAKLFYNDKVCPIPIDFIIDSGAQLTILSPNDAEKLGIGFDTLEGSKEMDIGGPGGKCIGRKLANAGILIRNGEESNDILETCDKMYVPDPERYPSNFSLIGHEILKRYNVITDNKTQKIILKLADSKYIPFPQ